MGQILAWYTSMEVSEEILEMNLVLQVLQEKQLSIHKSYTKHTKEFSADAEFSSTSI